MLFVERYLEMSKKSRIFAVAKNKKYHPLRPPSRWAKRQIDMKNSVTVKIERLKNKVVVSNDKGKKWEFPIEEPTKDDTSINGVVGHIASAMLTGTIASQLKELDSPILTYTVTLDTK